MGREGLAELWARLIESREWLRRFTDLGDAALDELLEQRRRFRAYWLMTFLQMVRFELELYGNPEADFPEVWRTVTRECLGIDSRSETYSQTVFLDPLDMKDYIYASLIGEAILGELETRFAGNLLNPEVFEFIVKTYYEMGNRLPWYEKFPRLSEVGAAPGE